MLRILPNVRVLSVSYCSYIQRLPHAAQLAIDKAAATRFIKNAIAQTKDTTPTNASGSGSTHMHSRDEPGNGNVNDKAHDVSVPPKITEKMLERERYHEALREEAQSVNDQDDEHLEIIDNDNDEDEDEGKVNAPVDSPVPDDVPPPSSTAAGKRRRPPIDPFAGLCSSR